MRSNQITNHCWVALDLKLKVSLHSTADSVESMTGMDVHMEMAKSRSAKSHVLQSSFLVCLRNFPGATRPISVPSAVCLRCTLTVLCPSFPHFLHFLKRIRKKKNPKKHTHTYSPQQRRTFPSTLGSKYVFSVINKAAFTIQTGSTQTCVICKIRHIPVLQWVPTYVRLKHPQCYISCYCCRVCLQPYSAVFCSLS